jgi:hypothetical protein
MSNLYPERQPLGRTQAQLLELKPGDAFVAVSPAHVRYCQALLARAGRDPLSFRIVSLESAALERGSLRQALIGAHCSVKIVLDHALLEETADAKTVAQVVTVREIVRNWEAWAGPRLRQVEAMAELDAAVGEAAAAITAAPIRWAQAVSDWLDRETSLGTVRDALVTALVVAAIAVIAVLQL